jgi:hypothetical protein
VATPAPKVDATTKPSTPNDSKDSKATQDLNILQQAFPMGFVTLICLIVYGYFYYRAMVLPIGLTSLIITPSLLYLIIVIPLWAWCYWGKEKGRFKFIYFPNSDSSNHKDKMPDTNWDNHDRRRRWPKDGLRGCLCFLIAACMLGQIAFFIYYTGGSLVSPFTQLLICFGLMSPIIANNKKVTPFLVILSVIIIYAVLSYGIVDSGYRLGDHEAQVVTFWVTIVAIIASFGASQPVRVLRGAALVLSWVNRGLEKLQGATKNFQDKV